MKKSDVAEAMDIVLRWQNERSHQNDQHPLPVSVIADYINGLERDCDFYKSRTAMLEVGYKSAVASMIDGETTHE